MVMGVDSRSKGRGFESQRRILDGHFFTLICCKNCIVCLKRPKINKKEAGVGPIFKKQFSFSEILIACGLQQDRFPIAIIYRVTLTTYNFHCAVIKKALPTNLIFPCACCNQVAFMQKLQRTKL